MGELGYRNDSVCVEEPVTEEDYGVSFVDERGDYQ